MTQPELLSQLRNYMHRNNISAVIIPGTDPHHSEYVAPHWQQRHRISGFTGSAGTAVVTINNAALWTDSRYFLQAEQQLQGSGFSLMRQLMPGVPTIEQWLEQELTDGELIAIDGRLFSVKEVADLLTFCGNCGFSLATDFYALPGLDTDLPARPEGKFFVHTEEFAGESVASKLERTRKLLLQHGASAMLVTDLADVAWILNLRGSDIPHTPVGLAYVYMDQHHVHLFADEVKITPDVATHLQNCGVQIHEYDAVQHFLERCKEDETVAIDPNAVSDTLCEAMPTGKVYLSSVIAQLKAVKNQVQIAGTRLAMERDGVALLRTFRQVEQAVAAGEPITEIDVARIAIKHRSAMEHYHDESFEMIAGYREHGAIVHYQATEECASQLQANGLLLVDSGAQYMDGTTDITRTLAFGEPTDEERHDYTLVLRGHLALQRAIFPEGTRGAELDVLAHQPLWGELRTYMHGTGHGVGHFLGVHEGPQSIRPGLNPTELAEGMITSNEPGLYVTGKHGIRIENLLLTVVAGTNDDGLKFLRFEPLTLYPYERKLIDVDMLTAQEREQINEYHSMVRRRLNPLLSADEQDYLNELTKNL